MFMLSASSSRALPRVQMRIMVFSLASQLGPLDSSLIMRRLSVCMCFLNTRRLIWSIVVVERVAKLSGLCLMPRSMRNRS